MAGQNSINTNVGALVALMAGYAGSLALHRLAGRKPALSAMVADDRRGRA